MTNSLLERLYGGLWGGAIGWAIEASDLGADFEVMTSQLAPSIVGVQQSLLWNEAMEVGEDWAKVLAIVFEAEERSCGDWAIAFPWAMNRSDDRKVTGFLLGTILGGKRGSRAIPVSLRVQYETLGIQSRSQAERMVRLSRGIQASTVPILA